MPAIHRMLRKAPKGMTSRPHHFAGRGCAVSRPCSIQLAVMHIMFLELQAASTKSYQAP